MIHCQYQSYHHQSRPPMHPIRQPQHLQLSSTINNINNNSETIVAQPLISSSSASASSSSSAIYPNNAAAARNDNLRTTTPPPIDPSTEEADELRVAAINGLSREERNQMITDTHTHTTHNHNTVADATPTTSSITSSVVDAALRDNEFIANKLSELDASLRQIRNKPAYLRAKMQSPDYVTNREFRLQFLLADSFQPRAAAERLAAYFESKSVLFGTDKLAKDLTLSDLTREEINCIELGVVQRLAGTDHAGRPVVSCWPTTTREPNITTENKLRAFWYVVNSIEGSSSNNNGNGNGVLYTSAIRDADLDDNNGNDNDDNHCNNQQNSTTRGGGGDFDVQKKGMVTVVFGNGPPGNADRTTLWKIMYLFRSIPTRVASIHFCYDNIQSSTTIVNLAIKALDPKSRARFRTHYGTHQDIVAELNTFGIGSNLLTGDPWSEEASMVIREWFAAQRHKEAQQQQNTQQSSLAAASSTTPMGQVVAYPSTASNDMMMMMMMGGGHGNNGPLAPASSSAMPGNNIIINNNNNAFSSASSSTRSSPSVLLLRRIPKNDIGHYDVLFGRGKGVQAHPGNKRLRELVEKNLERYENASRLEKTLIAETIVRNIKDASGRFLKMESASSGGGWTEVDFDTAREKIAHAFRTQRKSHQTQMQQREYRIAARAAAAAHITAATASSAGTPFTIPSGSSSAAHHRQQQHQPVVVVPAIANVITREEASVDDGNNSTGTFHNNNPSLPFSSSTTTTE